MMFIVQSLAIMHCATVYMYLNNFVKVNKLAESIDIASATTCNSVGSLTLGYHTHFGPGSFTLHGTTSR